MKLYPPAFLSTVFIDFSTIFYFLPPWRLDFGEFSLSKQNDYSKRGLSVMRFSARAATKPCYLW